MLYLRTRIVEIETGRNYSLRELTFKGMDYEEIVEKVKEMEKLGYKKNNLIELFDDYIIYDWVRDYCYDIHNDDSNHIIERHHLVSLFKYLDNIVAEDTSYNEKKMHGKEKVIELKKDILKILDEVDFENNVLMYQSFLSPYPLYLNK